MRSLLLLLKQWDSMFILGGFVFIYKASGFVFTVAKFTYFCVGYAGLACGGIELLCFT